MNTFQLPPDKHYYFNTSYCPYRIILFLRSQQISYSFQIYLVFINHACALAPPHPTYIPLVTTTYMRSPKRNLTDGPSCMLAVA